ncbi:hypothetical protein D3C76_1701420 [compost metagenome]
MRIDLRLKRFQLCLPDDQLLRIILVNQFPDALQHHFECTMEQPNFILGRYRNIAQSSLLQLIQIPLFNVAHLLDQLGNRLCNAA